MIDKQIGSPAEAVSEIFDGATVMIGGFGEAGSPIELIHALIDQGAKDLTVVNNNTGADQAVTVTLEAGGLEPQDPAEQEITVPANDQVVVRWTVERRARRHEPLSNLAGISSRISTRKSQNFFTVSIFTFSSGECGWRIVGPKEIISRWGYFCRKRPHSSPA